MIQALRDVRDLKPRRWGALHSGSSGDSTFGVNGLALRGIRVSAFPDDSIRAVAYVTGDRRSKRVTGGERDLSSPRGMRSWRGHLVREKTERRGQTASGFSDTEENLLFRGGATESEKDRRGGGREKTISQYSRIANSARRRAERERIRSSFAHMACLPPLVALLAPPAPSPLTHSLSFSRPSADPAAFASFDPTSLRSPFSTVRNSVPAA